MVALAHNVLQLVLVAYLKKHTQQILNNIKLKTMKTNKTQTEQLTQDAVMQSVLKESDLRIGNFIKVISSKKIFDSYITQAKGYDIVRIEEKSFTYWNYDPIPLDEEWLLKFGFSEIGGCNEKDFTNGDYNIFINSLGEVNFLFFREGDWYKKLDYVHQLQNLYFALTQRELTVA
jgi:hypothetical protein